MKTSYELLNKYLEENKIKVDLGAYIKEIKVDPINLVPIKTSLFDNIIADAFECFSEEIKGISNELTKKHDIFLGRAQKILIKRMIDYENFEEIEVINNYAQIEINLKKLILKYRNENIDKITLSKTEYFSKLEEAIINNNKKRVFDYLNFLYSTVLFHNEFKLKSVFDLFCENEKFIEKEFNKNEIEKFKLLCNKLKTKKPYNSSVKEFNDLYLKTLISSNQDSNDLVSLNISQDLMKKFKSKSSFYSYLFNLIEVVYEKIKNHRTLIIKIENIIFEGINLKWELYSYLTIFSENFKSYQETRSYYKPEEICFDFINHKYNLKENEFNLPLLKKYFKSTITIEKLNEETGLNLDSNEIDFFKFIHTGFQFIDCFILKSNLKFPNSKEIDFINNNNEILLVFNKHEIDDRKIPCPVCSSLKISGNSYPEIGIKSWECKNELCSERSKTNRGKRYSIRSIEMQNGLNNDFKENFISKNLISKWRKDIVSESDKDSLFEMSIKYFSYHEGNVLFLNFEEKKSKELSELSKSRNIKYLDVFDVLSLNKSDSTVFDTFLNNDFIKKFIYNNENSKKDKSYNPSEIDNYKIFNEDCLSFLNRVKSNSIDSMVTSPPYYNAREYSQWKNFYNYLNDMFKICQASFNSLKDGGVFFYNIGDIFDNPNIVVKSKMGEKRVALGAYLILIFQSAGFELLDNIIWDKGETQSNRHKNDGNYTPYYQRPANSYEHMFIFKKPGELIVSKEKCMTSNIQKFSPVIKINSKGENKFGHTAPYPVDLPLLSILTFTNKNDIIYDPFLGSGTSVYTAVINKRRGLGTEMDKAYFKLSENFINNKLKETKQMSLIF
jgi:DNA modification methylase